MRKPPLKTQNLACPLVGCVIWSNQHEILWNQYLLWSIHCFFFFFFTFKYYFFNSILPKYYSLILLLLIAALKFLLSANATQLLGLLRLYKLTLRFFISITKGEITGGKAAFTGSCLQVQDRYVVITDSSNSWARWLGWVNTHIFFPIIMKIIHRKRIHM